MRHTKRACVRCSVCGVFLQRVNKLRHFRSQHSDLCDTDGSCKAHHIPPRKGCIRKPSDLPVTSQEWLFVKRMVRRSIEHDMEKSRKTIPPSNENVHHLALFIVRELLRRKLVCPLHEDDKTFCVGKDDAGGVPPGGLLLRTHCLFQLTLDRRDDASGHFETLCEPLKNIALVPLAVNTQSSMLGDFGDELCREWRRASREMSKNECERVEKLIASESKSLYSTSGRSTALYCSCYEIWRRDAFARHDFDSFKQLRNYVIGVLREQSGRCAISNVPLVGKVEGRVRFPYQLSVDAIDPLGGHVRGNLRVVALCFQTTNRAKAKVWFDASDTFPTAWTSELFRAYVGESAHEW